MIIVKAVYQSLAISSMVVSILLALLLASMGPQNEVTGLKCLIPRDSENTVCLPEDYSKEVKPDDPGGGPNQIMMTVSIKQVLNVDDNDHTMTMTIYMDTGWQDKRLLINETSSRFGNCIEFSEYFF